MERVPKGLCPQPLSVTEGLYESPALGPDPEWDP